MIRKYQYVETSLTKLNDFVLDFFRTIERDTDGYRDLLFVPEFLPIVKRHYKILDKRFKEIYEYSSKLSDEDRHNFCQRVIDCNQIEKICQGEYRPISFGKDAPRIDQTLKVLFIDLYNKVIVGPAFQQYCHVSLRDHFDQFCKANEDITLCPLCGIGELKKSQDETRDQYDHYLPKALYPLSSINLYNLVLCCKECNSFDVKGEKDTIAVSTGKIFFPYDQKHRGISLLVNIRNDCNTVEEIEWDFVFSNPDNKEAEIESWKRIYSIEARYNGYIKARILKWYKAFFEFAKIRENAYLPTSKIVEEYIETLTINESLGLDYIRKPTVEGLLLRSNTIRAEIEAHSYS